MIKNVKLEELNTKIMSVALKECQCCLRTLKNRIEDICVKDAKNVKIRFDISRQLPKEKKKQLD